MGHAPQSPSRCLRRPGRPGPEIRSSGRPGRFPLLPRAPRVRPARARHAGRNGLHRAAQEAAVRPPVAFRQRAEGAAHGDPRLSRSARFPEERAQRHREALARQLRRRQAGRPAGAPSPQPARMAGGAAQGATGRRVLAAGARACSSRRRSTCGSTRSPTSGPTCRRSWRWPPSRPSPTPFSPWGLRIDGKPALDQARRLRARRGRGAGRRLATAGPAARRQARRDGGRFLRRRRRQDAGHRRHDAQHRPALRLRHLGAPARRAQAAAGAQQALERAPRRHRPRARRAHQAPGRQDRPGAGRRALLGPGHPAAQSGPQMAAVAASRSRN